MFGFHFSKNSFFQPKRLVRLESRKIEMPKAGDMPPVELNTGEAVEKIRQESSKLTLNAGKHFKPEAIRSVNPVTGTEYAEDSLVYPEGGEKGKVYVQTEAVPDAERALAYGKMKQEKALANLERKIGDTVEAQRLAKIEKNLKAYSLAGGEGVHRIDFKNDKKAEANVRLKDMFEDEYIQLRIGKENPSHPDKRDELVFAKKGTNGDYYFVGTNERVKTHTGDLVGSHLNEGQLASAKGMEMKVVALKGDLNKVLEAHREELAKMASEVSPAEMRAALESQKEPVITEEEPVIRSASVASRERAAREQEQVAMQFPVIDLRDENDPRRIAEEKARAEEELAHLTPGERYERLYGPTKETVEQPEPLEQLAAVGPRGKAAQEDWEGNPAMLALRETAAQKMEGQIKKPSEAEQRLAKAPQKPGKEPPTKMAGGKRE